MVLAVLSGVLAIGVVVAVLQRHAPLHAAEHARTAHPVHLSGRVLLPTSRAGRWAVGWLALAVAAGLAPVPQAALGGMPFGALAFLAGAVAVGRRQDASPLVVLAVVLGLLAVLLPVGWWATPTS